MTQHLMVKSTIAMATLAVLGSGLLSMPAWGQKYPITSAQTTTAQQVAQAGVALSELAPDAPDSYTVKGGDTLWGISSLFLRSPWRWPELWGMNMAEIKNPHLIYPGQRLVLEKKDGRATLRTDSASSEEDSIPTVRLSPRTRSEGLSGALSTLQTGAIEPFLAEPLIVEENELSAAARIVATQENRVMLSRGDRAYARGSNEAPLLDDQGNKTQRFRIFRNATPLKDAASKEILGFEAQFVGKATLFRGESTQETEGADGALRTSVVPATIDIVEAKEEMRVGDRMLPEPAREFLSYTPHVPTAPLDARIVSVYGSAVVNASQNQVVVINRGRRDGLESGHVMAILKDGQRLIDKTDPNRSEIKLPDERNGLLMVFKTFEKLSYGLILDTTDGVKIGDRLTVPR